MLAFLPAASGASGRASAIPLTADKLSVNGCKRSEISRTSSLRTVTNRHGVNAHIPSRGAAIPGWPNHYQPPEIVMSRKSGFLNGKLLLAGSCFALAISTGVAAAAPLENFSLAMQSSLVEAALACPPGTHRGYEGKYCWPNRARTCPAGFHLGYEGKYCWRNA